jgi:acyl-homoserine lactone synthase
MSQLIRQEGPRLDAIARANLCGLAASLRKTA